MRWVLVIFPILNQVVIVLSYDARSFNFVVVLLYPVLIVCYYDASTEITPVQRAVESLLPLSNAAAIVFMLPSDAEALRWCECITTLNKELRVVVHVHQANHAREFIKYGALVVCGSYPCTMFARS